MGGELTYLYAVVRPSASLDRADPSEAGGVADAPPRIVRVGNIAAVVGSVPEADYSEAALRNHLEDLDWLEEVARAHHSVVEFLAARTTVLPLRLATVYRDDDSVRAVLREGERAFAGMLDRFAGHVEWGVKVYADPVAASDAAAAEEPAESDPGRAYLRRRRQQRDAQGAARSAAVEAVTRIRETAGELAVERVGHRPQQGRLAASGVGENLVNDSYLVPEDGSGAFHERVRRAAREMTGVRVEVTGPWAPYSFVTLTGPDLQEGVRQS
ncbi:GvpL/GvpF family gas vesicle protein [Streptomyces exfoliatus]|uniref:GvpL/GvpF family gas vesicle protein n=1 Tax=Streptomyces exfoliatus TaxID=1905 RepID=UPI003C2BB8B6